MQKVQVTFDSMPSAIGLLLDRTQRLETIIAKLTEIKKEDTELTNGKRFADTNGVAKYLKCPRAQVYQLQHKGVIKGKNLPGSRRLYFDLDEIDQKLSK